MYCLLQHAQHLLKLHLQTSVSWRALETICSLEPEAVLRGCEAVLDWGWGLYSDLINNSLLRNREEEAELADKLTWETRGSFLCKFKAKKITWNVRRAPPSKLVGCLIIPKIKEMSLFRICQTFAIIDMMTTSTFGYLEKVQHERIGALILVMAAKTKLYLGIIQWVAIKDNRITGRLLSICTTDIWKSLHCINGYKGSGNQNHKMMWIQACALCLYLWEQTSYSLHSFASLVLCLH